MAKPDPAPVYCTVCKARLILVQIASTTYDPATGAGTTTTTTHLEHYRGVLHERWTPSADGKTWTRSER